MRWAAIMPRTKSWPARWIMPAPPATPIVLVGMRRSCAAELAKYDIAGLDLPVIHAAENIWPWMRNRPWPPAAKRIIPWLVGMRLVKTGEATPFARWAIPAALSRPGTWSSGGIPGVHRAVLTTPFPSASGLFILGDIGANPDCQPGVAGAVGADALDLCPGPAGCRSPPRRPALERRGGRQRQRADPRRRAAAAGSRWAIATSAWSSPKK